MRNGRAGCCEPRARRRFGNGNELRDEPRGILQRCITSRQLFPESLLIARSETRLVRRRTQLSSTPSCDTVIDYLNEPAYSFSLRFRALSLCCQLSSAMAASINRS